MHNIQYTQSQQYNNLKRLINFKFLIYAKINLLYIFKKKQVDMSRKMAIQKHNILVYFLSNCKVPP